MHHLALKDNVGYMRIDEWVNLRKLVWIKAKLWRADFYWRSHDEIISVFWRRIV